MKDKRIRPTVKCPACRRSQRVVKPGLLRQCSACKEVLISAVDQQYLMAPTDTAIEAGLLKLCRSRRLLRESRVAACFGNWVLGKMVIHE